MSPEIEQPLPENVDSDSLNPERSARPETLARCSESFNALQELVPEIAENREAIDAAASHLLEEFNVKPSLFDTKGAGLILASISSRWSETVDNTGKSSSEVFKEREFLTDAAFLLVRKHTDKFKDITDAIESEENKNGLTPDQKEEIYERFTDQQLTERLKEELKNGLLDDVKDKLHHHDDYEENDFEVRVLSVATIDYQLNGLSAPAYPDYYHLKEEAEGRGLNEEETRAYVRSKTDIADADVSDVNNWRNGLLERGREFMDLMGEDLSAIAWVSDIGDKRVLCLPSPIAEIILDPAITENAKYYTEDDLKRTKAVLKHEFTHTQGGVSVENDLNFGIALEERRAEYFSGDTQGYQDVKGFFSDLNIIADYPIVDVMERYENGGTPDELFSDIANRFGLSTMLEITMAVPDTYIQEQSNKLIKDVQSHLSGFNGVLSRILDSELAQGKGDFINQRIEKVVDFWQEKDIDAEMIIAMRNRYGLRVVEELLKESAIARGYITEGEAEAA